MTDYYGIYHPDFESFERDTAGNIIVYPLECIADHHLQTGIYINEDMKKNAYVAKFIDILNEQT